MEQQNEFKTARLAAGLTQKAMSELMEIPLRTIQDWEAGERTPAPYIKRFVLNKLMERRSKSMFKFYDKYKKICKISFILEKNGGEFNNCNCENNEQTLIKDRIYKEFNDYDYEGILIKIIIKVVTKHPLIETKNKLFLCESYFYDDRVGKANISSDIENVYLKIENAVSAVSEDRSYKIRLYNELQTIYESKDCKEIY